MKSRWFDYNGHKILFCDYANFKADLEALKAEVALVQAITTQQPEGSVLGLIDVRDTFISIEAARMFKQAATESKPHLRKTAVVGINSLLNIVAKSVVVFSGLKFSTFDDLESAKDWLAS